MISKHRLIYGNASNIDIDNDIIDLVVTSPPYPMIAMWDDMFIEQNNSVETAFLCGCKKTMFEEMHKVLDVIWSEMYRVVKPGGLCCINIGDATRSINKEFVLYPSHARIINYMHTLGFVSLPDILWRKQTNAPNKFMGSGMLPVGAYVTLEHEYILVFRKGFKKREFKTQQEKLNRKDSAFFWEERNVWFSDVWTDIKGTKQKTNNCDLRNKSAAFPLDLVYRLINMFSVKGDCVLDPFLGSGTTTIASMIAARNSIGVEIIPEFYKMLLERIDGLVSDANLYIDERIKKHEEFIKNRLLEGKNIKYINKKYGFSVVSKQEECLYINKLEEIILDGNKNITVKYLTN